MRIVIKFAGALLEDDATVRALARQVAASRSGSHEILVVHGGAGCSRATLERMAIESKFVAVGLRVTDRETRDVAVMVFAGLLNKKSSWAAISAEGQPAIGVFRRGREVFSSPSRWCTTKFRAVSASSATSLG